MKGINLLTNVDNGIKEPTWEYHISYNIILILIVGGHLKLKESLYPRFVIWVDAILIYIDMVMVFSFSYEGVWPGT